MRALLLSLLLIISLFANDEYQSTYAPLDQTTSVNEASSQSYSNASQSIEENVLYVSYQQLPDRIFKGQVFSLTIKVLSTISSSNRYSYELKDGVGVKLLTSYPISKKKDEYTYSTFYFLSIDNDLKTPDITVSIKNTQYHKTVQGRIIDVTVLNPDQKFSNVLSDNLTLQTYKSTVYDNKSNVVIFSIDAKNSNLETFHINNVLDQGIESIENEYLDSHLSYYVVVDKSEKKLTFTYFNITEQKYMPIYIPIEVDSDSVSTQSDIKPIDKGVNIFKISLAIFVLIVSILLFIRYKKIIYIISALIAAAYIAYSYIPIEHVCLKSSSNIYLLPMKNSTIFETSKQEQLLEVQGKIKNYTKVKLLDEKIGWIKNEDICVH